MTKQELQIVFAKHLRELLVRENLSINELAKAINISPRAIEYYLNCKRLPKINIVSDISYYFNVSIDSLFREGISF